ncbi:MAG TPA: DedA family protein [Rectinemataceae bacterium]|nr:DedA family protein [Rectinemataceae bacterium]
MTSLGTFIDVVLHVDRYLVPLIQQYGAVTYLFMFLLIFAETGLVVTPFLPGDSVLFALGALAAVGRLDIGALAALLMTAAVLGNVVNYAIGRGLGPAVFSSDSSRFFRRDYLDRTHEFYERYGAVTVIVARFMPIIRTFVPFVAGIGRMSYPRFFLYNLIGSVAWVALMLSAGYFFGGFPLVRDHFSLVTLAIIAISLLPPVLTALRVRLRSRGTKR